MLRLFMLSLALACVGCGLLPKKKPEEPVAPYHLGWSDEYRLRVPSVQREAGFVESDKCDSLLWSSLLAASGVPGINVQSAEDPEQRGRWYRRPVALPECFAEQMSRATISRDMLMGVLWWAWTFQREDVIRSLYIYGESRAWRMGDGRLGGVDTILNPNMLGLLSRLCLKLDAGCGGSSETWAGVLPLSFVGDPHGYERHLEVLMILLDSEVANGLSFPGAVRLWKHYNEEPTNPLFAAALARYNEVSIDEVESRIETLGYSLNSLPTSADWCSDWRTQNDASEPGAQPCLDKNETHSGGEIIFIDRVLRGPDLVRRGGVQ